MATAMLWGGEDSALADSSSVEGCVVNADARITQEVRPAPSTTKEPRELPFAEPEDAVFTVRLNRILDHEVDSGAFRLAGVEEGRSRLLANPRFPTTTVAGE